MTKTTYDMTLDAHAKPPARLREVYKEQQRAKTVNPGPTPDISPPPGLRITDAARLPSDIRDAFDSFVCHLPVSDAPSGNTSCVGDILEVSEIPGKIPAGTRHFPPSSEPGRSFRISVFATAGRPAISSG
jgi:hypothetical protein